MTAFREMIMSQEPATPGASRRQVMTTGVVVMTGVVGLAACGSSASTASPAPSGSAAAPADSAPAGGVVAKVSDVKVGTAISAKTPNGKPIIVSQPTAGKVVAFTAICTHMGCTVLPAGGLKLMCPCHGSTYNAATGQNTGGPAPSPLAAVKVTVEGGSVVVG
jgi:cytochrome b6-f complex iron-sulfur subunit